MKKILSKGLSIILAVVMIAGLLPTTVFAAVDSTGRPKDVNNELVLSIYTGSGFPGEPVVYSTTNYKNYNSKFEVKSGATFANSAKNQLDWNKIQEDIVQGTSSGSTSVWGVYDANGTKDYFLENASIIQPENEAKMIRAIKTELKNKSDAEVLQQYEIVWYVIKLQHSSGWFGATEWHIDGVIKEKEKISINYYGNGNTSGSAPLGTASHTAGDPYTVLDQNTMVREIYGVEVAFLGWSAKADGTGAEAGFYQPGDVINPKESISLYAMWDTTTQYTATVSTYLDGALIDADEIHGHIRDLYLSTDEEHYYPLTRSSEGVYTTKITGNGKFHLYNKEEDGTYEQIGNYQLTIYNQNGHLDIQHYSVTYDANGGNLAAESNTHAYYYGKSVTAIETVPTKNGYRFLGWKDDKGNLIQPGAEVTSSIEEPITLTAQWEKTVDITINVTINHEGGDGYDKVETKGDVFLALASRENDQSPYLEVKGKTLSLSDTSHSGFAYSESEKATTYTGYTYTDMPGGEVDYTVVTSKSGYDTVVTATQNNDGNWIIDVVMAYNPTNFDFEFAVKVDNSVPDQYVPNAAIVKVTFWSNANNQWEIITQQENNLPGVRVDIDPDTRSGSDSYPVWKYESNGETPYGYRIQVTSFVYPDGTIVPASDVVTQDVAWSDNVYIATVSDVIGGKEFGNLDGAYFDNDVQLGELNAVITMDLYDVTFDANGGLVNGKDYETVEKQYKIPGFNAHVPTREGGYIFDGWYEDSKCTVPATEGKDLSADITLYAKWIEPLTIRGTVAISGTYEQDGATVSVHDIDRATEAVVVLQAVRNGIAYDVDSVTVSFGKYGDIGSADYSFAEIPNDGKTYQIHVLVLNYGTTYDNESDTDKNYSANEFLAVLGGDNVADIDVNLEFVPPSYNQALKVDATAIGEDYRPTNVLAEVLYRDTGDNHAFERISQHNVPPYGVQIGLNAGLGSSTESIWKWHTDGTLYEYQMNITNVDGVEFDGDTAPFYIEYAAPSYWNGNTDQPSGELKATLIPNQYMVTFNLNADGDTVTGMDAYWKEETGYYQATHTWSFDTAISATPVRAGYTFKGWEADIADAYDGSKIGADVHQNVVLTAKWEKSEEFAVITVADPVEGGVTFGAGSYAPGTNVTVTATANENYQFDGWYENDEKVFEEAEYSFSVTGNRTLTAKFIPKALNYYRVTAEAIPADGGTVTGSGTYLEGTKVTLSAEVNEGYTFVGWFEENGSMITTDKEFTYVVTGPKYVKARYNMISTYKNDYAYIFGYSDTVMGAEGPLLRSEASVMVHRLVKQNNERGDFVYNPSNPSFSDIAGQWFQCGIEYIHYRGGFSSAEGSKVYPNEQITRGEVFKIVTLGLGFTEDTTLSYEGYGAILAGRGYIIGSGGSGVLDCYSYMTRAEFCTMYNRIIGRTNALLIDANGNQITAETYGFTDLKPKAWYYEDMLRATSAYDENGFVDLSKRAQRNVVDDYS